MKETYEREDGVPGRDLPHRLVERVAGAVGVALGLPQVFAGRLVAERLVLIDPPAAHRIRVGIAAPTTVPLRLRNATAWNYTGRAGAGSGVTPTHPSGPSRPGWRHGRDVRALDANVGEMIGNMAYTFDCLPALQPYIQLQLLSARVSVQTVVNLMIGSERNCARLLRLPGGGEMAGTPPTSSFVGRCDTDPAVSGARIRNGPLP